MGTDPKQCRERALRCTELAERATDPTLKAVLTELAERWQKSIWNARITSGNRAALSFLVPESESEPTSSAQLPPEPTEAATATTGANPQAGIVSRRSPNGALTICEVLENGKPPTRYIQVIKWHCAQEGGGVGLRCKREAFVSSVVPLFRDRGFDPEATQILGKAYDIACRSLHPKGQPPVVQELLAKKIIEAAQHGERDPDRLAGIALGLLGPLHREVSQRFGLIPNFFVSTPDAPEIIEKLWDFAKSAYLDSPIPALFKERLFVFLSRFCQVRYCIARHCAFLVGYGYASGDALAARQSIEQALKLLKVPPPWRRPLEPIYERLEAVRSVIDWPDPESDAEDWIFAMCALIFVEPTKSERALQVLRQALGAKRLEYLLALLAFIRTAHYWTETHPALEIEQDVRELMALHEELASLLLQGSDLG